MTTPTLRDTIRSMRGNFNFAAVVAAHQRRTGETVGVYAVACELLDMEYDGEVDVSYEDGYRNVEESDQS